MNVESFIIEGRKPFKVIRTSGGFNWKPSYLIITDKEIERFGIKVKVTEKPTAYQRKKIYEYMRIKERGIEGCQKK